VTYGLLTHCFRHASETMPFYFHVYKKDVNQFGYMCIPDIVWVFWSVGGSCWPWLWGFGDESFRYPSIKRSRWVHCIDSTWILEEK